jgi:cytochrome P450
MTITEAPQGAVPTGVPHYDYNQFLVEPVMAHTTKMDELREMFPAFWNTNSTGFWVLTRMDEIRDALQTPGLFSSTSVIPTEPDPPYKWIPEMVDPPEHTKWRQFLSPMFTPAAINIMEAKVRHRCVELIEPLVAKGGCDFMNDFAWRYPTTVFMEMMGLPLEDIDQFLAWERDILHLPADEDPDRSKAYAAMVAVQGYFDELIKLRRQDPRDDLLSRSIHWTIDAKPIPHEDLLSFCLLMFMAGLDTVSIQLSFSWYHFANHPEDRARIVAEPELIPVAIEELLRFYSFVPTGRKVMQDTEFAGCPMKAGQMVHMYTPAACRDPRAFDNADRFIIDRELNAHIAFGAGPHRCLGSHLARRELKIAIEEWHKRIPNYRVDPSVPVMEHGAMIGIDALSLLWDV